MLAAAVAALALIAPAHCPAYYSASMPTGPELLVDVKWRGEGGCANLLLVLNDAVYHPGYDGREGNAADYSFTAWRTRYSCHGQNVRTTPPAGRWDVWWSIWWRCTGRGGYSPVRTLSWVEEPYLGGRPSPTGVQS